MGTTVIFRNDDPDPHTITSETGAFAEGQVDQSQEYKFTFTAEGEFPYFCQYHGAKGGVGMAGIIKVGPASSIAAALPTEVTPRQSTPQPTAAEPPAAALAPDSVGFGAFIDVNARSDGFELKVAGLPPAAGEYHAWLTGSGQPRDLGALQLDSTGAALLRYTDAAGENLLATFTGFVVTAETAGSQPASPSADVLISSTLPEGVRDPVRQLLVASNDAPDKAAYTFGLVFFVEDLVRHAKAVNGAAVLGDTDGINRHSEHMLALLEGKDGPDYKDVDGNGVIQDPGDGYGILRYADSIAAQAAAAANAPDVTGNVRTHVAEIQVLAVNLRAEASQLVDIVLKLRGASAADRQALAGQALVLARTMLDGKDNNGNGVIEPLAREGGAYTTYAYAQYLAALGAVPAAGSGIATAIPPTQTSEPTTTQEPGATPRPTEQPTATPQPTATTPAVAATPKPVFITYRNFEIVPGTTTIKVGTTVTFLIEGTLHEPYAGSAEPFIFDSGPNLGPGS
ncbi:MAG: hypothetical protein ABI847_21385, partial [Anaerolineales bacterium]